ncbi:MAG: TolC family protein [Gammaproteobacteria bacterium]|jgi:cobalt-zinc-cadmium efflux system outer membrane protein
MKTNKLILLFCLVLLLSENAGADPLSHSYFRNVVKQVLDSHPAYQAAHAKVLITEDQARAAGLPLYNPEIEAEMESAGEDTYVLGIAQSIDWHDKQSAKHFLQQIAVQNAKAEQLLLATTLASQTLNALIDYSMASGISRLHQQRIDLLEQVVDLAEQRLAAGDINKSELLLAKISLGNAIIKQANQKMAVIKAKNEIFKLSPQGIAQAIDNDRTFDGSPPDNITSANVATLASQHPSEKIALMRVEHAKQKVQVDQRQRRADPRFGINVGKEGDESLVGLKFSIDWQVRNDFAYAVDMARNAQLQKQLEAQNIHRQIVADIKSAKSQYQIAQEAWQYWLNNGESQLQQHVALLKKLWRSGEISTSNYLLQLEQNIHTQISGASLQGNAWHAWIQWLDATGQLLDWLKLTNEFDTKGEPQ